VRQIRVPVNKTITVECPNGRWFVTVGVPGVGSIQVDERSDLLFPVSFAHIGYRATTKQGFKRLTISNEATTSSNFGIGDLVVLVADTSEDDAHWPGVADGPSAVQIGPTLAGNVSPLVSGTGLYGFSGFDGSTGWHPAGGVDVGGDGPLYASIDGRVYGRTNESSSLGATPAPVIVGGRDGASAARTLAIDSQGRPSASAWPLRPSFYSSGSAAAWSAAGTYLLSLFGSTTKRWLTRLAIWNPGSATAAALRVLHLRRITADGSSGLAGGGVRGSYSPGSGLPAFDSGMVIRNGGTGFTDASDNPIIAPLYIPAAIGPNAPFYLVGGPGADESLMGGMHIPAGSGVALKDMTGGAGSANLYYYSEWITDVDTSSQTKS
jgi:hypothetical protein